MTNIKRAGAICDALVNGTATAAQKVAVADAFVAHFRNEIISAGLDPDNLTNEQKAKVFVITLKRHVKTIVRINNADISAAKDAVVTAEATANADAEKGWPSEDLSE